MSDDPDEMVSAVEQWLHDNPPLTNAALRSRITALEAELDQAVFFVEEHKNTITALEAELAAERAKVERLIEAGRKLNNHACHDDDCQIVTHGVWSDPIPCTCGYENAWKSWAAALASMGGDDE